MKVRHSKSQSAVRRTAFVCSSMLCLLTLLIIALVPTKTTGAAAQGIPPKLLTRANTNRAIALESATFVTSHFL